MTTLTVSSVADEGRIGIRCSFLSVYLVSGYTHNDVPSQN